MKLKARYLFDSLHTSLKEEKGAGPIGKIEKKKVSDQLISNNKNKSKKHNLEFFSLFILQRSNFREGARDTLA